MGETHTSLSLQESLWKKFEKHIFFLRYIGEEKTKHDWITEAIEEKLSKKEYADLKDLLEEAEKRLTISLDDELNERLEDQIELSRKVQGSYSKKQLIIEAIIDKLERKREELKDIIKKTTF